MAYLGFNCRNTDQPTESPSPYSMYFAKFVIKYQLGKV